MIVPGEARRIAPNRTGVNAVGWAKAAQTVDTTINIVDTTIK